MTYHNCNLYIFRIYSVSPPPPQCVLRPPVTNYMLLYSTLICKKIARVPGGRKKYKLIKLGGQNRIDPIFLYVLFHLIVFEILTKQECRTAESVKNSIRRTCQITVAKISYKWWMFQFFKLKEICERLWSLCDQFALK